MQEIDARISSGVECREEPVGEVLRGNNVEQGTAMEMEELSGVSLQEGKSTNHRVREPIGEVTQPLQTVSCSKRQTRAWKSSLEQYASPWRLWAAEKGKPEHGRAHLGQ